MGSATGFSAARMLEIEESTVVGGFIDLDGRLLLERRDGETIVAGIAKGAKGDPGDAGADYKYAAGFIQMWSAPVPPQGWVFCDGGELSRATYPDLYAAIGLAYGPGNGVTTFNVPDMRGRVPAGMDLTQVEFNLLGKKGGEKAHRHDFMFGLFDRNWAPAGSYAGMEASTQPNDNDRLGAYRYSTGKFQGAYGGTPGTSTSALSVNSNINSSSVATSQLNREQSVGDTDLGSSLSPYQTVHFIISLGTSGFVGGGTPIPVNMIGRGTTTERNALFGIPGNVAQQVALANQKPTWWNTTTDRLETYYAVTGSPGLLAPGLWTSGFSAGWYSANPSTEWAGKSGPTSWTVGYKATWARGVDSGGVLNATADVFGVRIGLTGIYEVNLQLRGSANGANEYAALALNGDRGAFENRSLNLPITGIWTHAHPASINNFSPSYYLGQLLAGDLITGGPASINYAMPPGNAPSSGMLTVRRVA